MKAYYYHYQIHEIPFVNNFAGMLGMPSNTLHAEGILCAFFKTLRERIPLYASRALIAHLPSDVRPFYKIGWNHEFSTTFDYYEFIEALFNSKNKDHVHLFRSRSVAEAAVSAFFEVIKEKSTEDEFEDLMSYMPFSLRMNLLRDYVFEGHSYIV